MSVVTIGDCTLYLGDSLAILPTLSPGSVDAVVTDPPYGIGFGNYASHDDDPEAYESFMSEIIDEVQRLVTGGPVFMWQGMLNADRWHRWLPPGFRLFAACKGFVQFRPTPVQFSWDPVAFWGTVRKDASVHAKDWHVQRLAPFGAKRKKINHPCPRPVEQVRYVVDLATRVGDTVLDPFLGSGTTGVACVRLGRKFIGIERDPGYFADACDRIREAVAAERDSLFPVSGSVRSQLPLEVA